MKKGFLIMALILAAFFFQGEKEVYADQAIIQVDHLNVRTGPGTNHDRIGKVHSNESYNILEQQGDWLNIQWNGKTGWVAKWLTKVESEASYQSSYTSKYDYLRIRSAPNLSGNFKGYLMKGDQVKAQDKNGKWVYIQHGSIRGWVHGDYLTTKSTVNSSQEDTKDETSSSTPSVKGKVKVGTAVLNVRSQGSLRGKVLSQVRRDQVYEYIDEKNRWYHINYGNGKAGWVAGWLVNKASGESTSTNDHSGDSYVSLNYNGTNIRSGASTNHKILGRAHKGDQFQVVSKEGQWFKIHYKQSTAYVAGWIVDEHKGESSSSSPNISDSLKGKTIMLDAGHGGRDSGAIGRSGSYEKTVTLDTAYSLKKQLESKGARVLMTRSKDEYISLAIRSYYAKRSKADAFISLHYNSAPLNIIARGISSYYYHSKDKQLASSVQSAMVSSTGLGDRGIKKGNFHVIRENNKPAVLLELGFLSDAREEQTIKSNSYQTQVSQGITKGLINYFR